MKKIIFILLVIAFIAAGCTTLGQKSTSINPEDAKSLAADFINNNLMKPGNTVSIKEVIEESGVYKIVVNMTNGEEIDSYMSKDGKIFFPQPMVIDEIVEAKQDSDPEQASNPAATVADVPKAATAKVELFVMSHCPYGTQIEKGILPVLKTLGDKVDFELKFCDYAMHGETEIKEQLNQYCIQKNEPKKFTTYLECFLDKGDGDSCLKTTGINTTKMNSCVATTDQEFQITDNFENNVGYRGRYPGFNIYKVETAEYAVSGSPTLVINGKKISSGRDSNTLLKNICAGYENPPAECDTVLTSAAPAPGFGFGGTASGATAAECGN